MSFTLSPSELIHVEAAQRVLLSPLDHPSASAWWGAVSQALRPLFGHEWAITFLDAPGFAPEGAHVEAIYVKQGGPAAYFQRGALNEGYRPGGPVTAEGMTVYDAEATALRGAAAEGIRAHLLLYHKRWKQPGGEERRRYLFRLLYPCFEAGVRAGVRLGAARSALTVSLDQLGFPLLAFDADGRVLHATHRVEVLLADEPERASVLENARRLATSAAALHRAGHVLQSPLYAEDEAPGRAFARRVVTAAAQYEVQAVMLSASLFGQEAVAVALETATPALPSEAFLRERYGLTRQEARVALLLAERRRNTEIGEVLAISPHTARHHVERVMTKLGVHTRREVAGVLVEIGGEQG